MGILYLKKIKKKKNFIFKKIYFLNSNVANDSTMHNDDERAIRELNRRLRDDKRVDICMLPISDGLTLCLKRE